MIPLLCAAALMDTVIAIEDYDCVVIHEWGVITASEEALDFTGYPGREPVFDPVLDDRAPVVNFYGMDFREAEFTVTLSSGEFTDFHPIPDAIDDTGRTAAWNIKSGNDLGSAPISEEYIPATSASLEWDMDGWRDGISHVLEFDDGSMERFIYYECSLPLSTESPLSPFSSGGGLSRDYRGEVLVFTAEGGNGMKMTLCRWPDMPASTGEMEPYTREQVLSVLCSWAGGGAKSHELEDLWSSWEEYVTASVGNNDRLLVFQVPVSSMETVSRLELTTSEGYEILTERFFLGMVAFDWVN